MDGVLVDFAKGYFELTGRILDGSHEGGSEFWRPINRAGYDFWYNLEWMSDGKELWKHIEKYNPILLSAPSSKDESKVAKFDWVKRELPGVELILRSASKKREFAGPNNILIDDRPSNIEGWVEDGGIGILHTSATETIRILVEDYKIF